MCGDLCGDMWRGCRGIKKDLPGLHEMQVYLAGLSNCLLGSALVRLDQIQLSCPFDSRPAIIDVEFAVDALGMCADCAQGDHELIGDLRKDRF